MEAGQHCLRNFLKNIKVVVNRKLAKDPQYKVRAVIGNQGCDPDSVVGAVLITAMKAIQEGKKSPTFANAISSLLTEQFNAEQEIPFEPVLPVINNETNDFIRDKADLDYLNKSFNLGLEEIIPISWLASLEAKKTPVELILHDHNAPERNVRHFVPSATFTEVYDHHAIVDEKFTSTIKHNFTEPSGSGFSVVLRRAEKEDLELLVKYFPELARVSSVVMFADAKGFSEKEKDTRWWDYDLTFSKDFGKINGMTKDDMKKYRKGMKEALNDPNEFKKPLSHLTGQDQKIFTYEITKEHPGTTVKIGDKIDIVFSSVKGSYDTFGKHFKEEGVWNGAVQEMDKYKAFMVIYTFITSESEGADEEKRDMTFYSRDKGFAKHLPDSLIKSGLNLVFVREITPPSGDTSGVYGFLYANPTSDIRRKVAEAAMRPLM